MALRGYGSGSGNTHGYTVEIRTNSAPMQHPMGFLIDGEWRRVPYRIARCDKSSHNHFESGKVGEIPVWNYCHELDNLELVNQEAAYALAVQLLAQVWNGGLLEVRLVQVGVEFKYSAYEMGVTEPISLGTLRAKFAKREGDE